MSLHRFINRIFGTNAVTKYAPLSQDSRKLRLITECQRLAVTIYVSDQSESTSGAYADAYSDAT